MPGIQMVLSEIIEMTASIRCWQDRIVGDRRKSVSLLVRLVMLLLRIGASLRRRPSVGLSNVRVACDEPWRSGVTSLSLVF